MMPDTGDGAHSLIFFCNGKKVSEDHSGGKIKPVVFSKRNNSYFVGGGGHSIFGCTMGHQKHPPLERAVTETPLFSIDHQNIPFSFYDFVTQRSPNFQNYGYFWSPNTLWATFETQI